MDMSGILNQICASPNGAIFTTGVNTSQLFNFYYVKRKELRTGPWDGSGKCKWNICVEPKNKLSDSSYFVLERFTGTEEEVKTRLRDIILSGRKEYRSLPYIAPDNSSVQKFEAEERDLPPELDETLNNFSYWFPKVENCGIAVPKSFFAKIPSLEAEPEFARRIWESFYMEDYQNNIATIQEWLDRDVIPHLKELRLDGLVFVKNARFSNKFDANRSCILYGIEDLAQHVARINYESLCLGADGGEEIVIRQFIPYDMQKTPCIYNGLPFRNEFRVFYDFDKQEPIFTVNYWDYDYVYPHLYHATDRIIFKHERERMEDTYNAKKDEVQAMVGEAMKNVTGLSGQWSVDILLDEGGTYWLIDMAVAQRSAYWELKPEENKEETHCEQP